ncbi:MAG: GH3 auxin-responsive promoter family protein [Flavobacteriales bacterium]|nr:GH3 auxin-responsive promoter family protein [Flavobacteriales bacterium]
MPILKNILDKSFKISLKGNVSAKRGHSMQLRTLKKLIAKAQYTEFGKAHHFNRLLDSANIDKDFAKLVPAGDYLSMLPWWDRCKTGEPNVTWPGKIDFFAVSSGSTDNSSKYIPFTREMNKAIHRASLRQIFAIAKTDVPKDHIMKNWLMIGGSTDLEYNGIYHSGDLSGITTSHIPLMLQRISKPEPVIKQERNWQEKIEKMTREAVNWDVGIIAGVPAWIQMLMENILEHYKISNIHEIWPNLEVYIHGGVSIKPYKKGLDKLMGRPIKYFETYLASEGFIAFQNRESASGMRLLLRNGIYYEFIPFNSKNFTDDGNLIGNPMSCNLLEVDENTDYALAISTCAGAWRYLIGDVIRFSNLKNCEIEIVGRTKHFLSLCGEHLSVDNMNKGLELTGDELGVQLIEYTVAGIPHKDGLFAHQWYIGYDAHNLDPELVKTTLDKHLKVLNDDYRVERSAALKDIYVELIPNETFISWLKSQGKFGSQNKFPRVLKNEKLESWKNHLQTSELQKTI